MELRQVFNIFLLGLILTTIIITLVVYLVFKFRQGIQVIREKSVELEGEFFVRYAPHLKEKHNKAIEEMVDQKRNTNFSRHKSTWLIGGTFFIIVSFLALENYISFRGTLMKRQTTAEQYIDLIKEGLLKKHPFLPTEQIEKPFESLETYESPLQTYYLEQLREEEIIIILSDRNFNRTDSYHKKALKRWDEFCLRWDLICKKEKLTNIKKPTKSLMVLANTESLNASERAILDKLIALESSIVFVGPVGVFNGLFKLNAEDWYLKTLSGSELQKNTKKDQALASKFIFSDDSLFDLSAEALIFWSPMDSRFSLLSSKKNNHIVYSDYLGREIERESKYIISYKNLDSGLSWLASNPILIKNKSKHLEKYSQEVSDQFLIQLLSSHSKKQHLKLAKWPKAHTSAVSVSIVAQDNFLKLSRMTKKLMREELVSTIFVQADSYDNFYPDLYKDYMESDLSDVSIVNLDSSRFSELSFKEAFEKIETARLLVERKNKVLVKGLYPKYAELSPKLVNASHQNALSYLVGNAETYTKDPIRIENTDIFVFPKGSFDDKSLVRKLEIVSPEDLEDYFERQKIQRDTSASLMQLHFHTDVFGDDDYFPFYTKSINWVSNHSKVWKTNYKNILKWNKKRSNIQIQKKENNYSLVNSGLEPISDLVMRSNFPVEGSGFRVKKAKDAYLIYFDEIPAGQRVDFKRTTDN